MKVNPNSPITGIIGLGSMGIGMAKNIIDAGISLKGYDLNQSALETFSKFGGLATKNVQEAAVDCDLLILMVVNAEQVQEILFGSENAARVVKSNATIMINSTISPKAVGEINEKIEKMGLSLLDAPVSGGKIGADTGELIVMASGTTKAFKAAEKVLDVISKKTFMLGNRPGVGSTYKIVLQLATGSHLAVAAELMAFGTKAGCDPETLFEIVSNSSGQSWMMDDRVPQMIKGEFKPRSMVDIFVKDLGLVMELGQQLEVPLPLSTAAFQVFQTASGMGHGNLDDSAVVKFYEAATSCPVSDKNTK